MQAFSLTAKFTVSIDLQNKVERKLLQIHQTGSWTNCKDMFLFSHLSNFGKLSVVSYILAAIVFYIDCNKYKTNCIALYVVCKAENLKLG